MNTKDFYEENQEFRDYVDNYAKNYNEGRSIPVEEALNHAVIVEYEKWIRGRM